MLSLASADIPVSDWLGDVSRSPGPNAEHAVLAHLAAGGAWVGGSNFDDGIEQAAPLLDETAPAGG